MEPIYVGDLLPSIASYKKIIEKYDKGIKEGEFYEDLSNLSKNINYSKKKKLKLFKQVVRIIKGKDWG